MLRFLREVGQDAKRCLQALAVVEALPMFMVQTQQHITDMSTFKEIVLKGIDYLADQNAALKSALETSGSSTAALEAQLTAAKQELASFLAAEAEEDAQQAAADTAEAADRQEILARLGSLMPADVAPEAPAEEPVAEALEEPVAEATEEPVAEAVEEPVAEVAEEPVAEAAEEPVAEVAEGF